MAVAAITGASAGVGRAIARRFAEDGFDIGLIARGEEGLDGARKEAEAAGVQVCTVIADVADPEQVERAGSRIEAELGPIDVWVNDAMASVFAAFTDIEPDEFRRVTDVTYHGYVNGTRAALRRMLPRDRGVVVQIGSALAYRGIPMQSAYCGAKHAIEGFTASVRTELMGAGSAVRIGLVQLPAVNTPQFEWVLSRLPRNPQPVPPVYQPELVADAVLAMAHRPRREMWLGLSTVQAIVGNRVLPGALDWMLARTGIDSQQTAEPAEPGRPSNLWDPVPGDHGAHGPFDGPAHESSPAIALSIRRRRRVLGVVDRAVGALLARIM